MKIFKIVVISLLGLLDLYSLYAWIGYLVLGIQTPDIIGTPATTFMGMYLMSITFFAIWVVVSIVIIVLCMKFYRKK